MNRSILEKERNGSGSVAVSVVVHVVVIALIASITFRYPLAAFFGIDKDRLPTEHITFVKVEPQPASSVGNGVKASKKPKKLAPAAPLIAPTVIPQVIPPAPPPDASVGSVTGTTTGTGGTAGAAVGAATGLAPAVPDSRIELRPHATGLPLTMAQKNDSAVKAIFMAYREAEVAAAENRGKSPRDWTVEHNGQKYGLDSQYIYLGKFKLPSAILAALPMNFGGVDGNRIRYNRNADWISNDIYSHSQGLSEDDFNAAVKRIRERKDRERKEAEESKDKASKPTPIVP